MNPHRMRAMLLTGLASLLLLAGCATPLPPAEPPGAEPVAESAPDSSTESAAAPVAAAASAPLPPAAPASAVALAAQTGNAVDPVRPDETVDLDDNDARSDLWERVRRGFAMADLDTADVQRYERWYASRPDYVERMTERGGRYLFHIVEEVERRGLPSELALLPFIESAFNPQAVSSAKASGMWQFMPATGRHYALTQNMFRDDRRDVLASTRAALDYLEYLHGMFGDWQLALAAYNWGEGNVRRAIARNERAGKPADYLSLRMPLETRHYVPKLQAVKNLIARPEAYDVSLPELQNHPYFLSVPITRDIDVATAIELSGMRADEFRSLNPQHKRPVILAAGTPQLLMPYDNANLFLRRLAKHDGPLASWTAWVAPRTLHPSDVAKQVGMSEDELREANGIPPRMLVTAGSTLLVPREPRHRDVAEEIAENATLAFAPERNTRRVVLRAGRHDTVASVARRYHVSADSVAAWNKVSAEARFKRGQRIVLHLAAKPSQVQAKRRPAASAKASQVAKKGSAGAAKAKTRVAAKKPSAQVAKRAAKDDKVAVRSSGE